MYLIEPCCATRHLMLLRDIIKNNGTREFEGYGDLSLTELLPAIMTRYSETDLLIAAPSLPDQAADVIAQWMGQQWSRRNAPGKVYAIRHLTIIAGMSRRKAPIASSWAKDDPFDGRLTVVNRQQEETVILLPDFAVIGPVNMRYGEHFVATATTDPERIAELWKKYAVQEESVEDAADAVETPAGEPVTAAADITEKPAAASEPLAEEEVVETPAEEPAKESAGEPVEHPAASDE